MRNMTDSAVIEEQNANAVDWRRGHMKHIAPENVRNVAESVRKLEKWLKHPNRSIQMPRMSPWL